MTPLCARSTRPSSASIHTRSRNAIHGFINPPNPTHLKNPAHRHHCSASQPPRNLHLILLRRSSNPPQTFLAHPPPPAPPTSACGDCSPSLQMPTSQMILLQIPPRR